VSFVTAIERKKREPGGKGVLPSLPVPRKGGKSQFHLARKRAKKGESQPAGKKEEALFD